MVQSKETDAKQNKKIRFVYIFQKKKNFVAFTSVTADTVKLFYYSQAIQEQKKRTEWDGMGQ
jgi:hypothetical protein